MPFPNDAVGLLMRVMPVRVGMPVPSLSLNKTRNQTRASGHPVRTVSVLGTTVKAVFGEDALMGRTLSGKSYAIREPWGPTLQASVTTGCASVSS